jgi:hypothetical protein
MEFPHINNLTKKFSHIIFFLILFLCSKNSSFSQNSFGVEFGHNWRNYGRTINDLDSIRIISGGADTGEGFGGLFYEFAVSKNISIHNKLNYRINYGEFSLFNKDAVCQFCPVRKIKIVGINSFSFEVLPQLTLIQFQDFKLNLFGGFNASFNFVSENIKADFRRQPGLSSVFNSVDAAVNPVTFSFAYGASMEIWRILFWAKVNPPAPFSNSIEVNDREYDFDNSWGFVSFSIGYKFYSLKRNKNSEVEN